MYFARTLLVPVILFGGLVEEASAQHKYIFPQFAFGAGWESTLMVQASATPTTCTFSAQGRFLTMRDSAVNNFSGTSLTLTFGMNGWTILKTATPQGMAVSSGMAVLDCSEEVSANALFSLEVGGSLVSEAVVQSAEEILSGVQAAQFLADHRDGARFGVAVANPSNQPISVVVLVADLDGQEIGNTTVALPANDSQAFFVDDLVTIPTGHTGQVVLGATGSLHAIGLRFTGLVFTTIPATVSYLSTTPEPTTPWSRSGTGSTILDLPTRITRIRIEGEYTGSNEIFVVWCGGPGDRGELLVNELMGTFWSLTRYSGVHSTRRSYNNRGDPCRELHIEHATGVRWTITEVAPASGLSRAVSSGSLSADLDAVERARVQVIP